MSQETTNRSFDELAKGLATGTLSRGKALRLVGGALLGAALASNLQNKPALSSAKTVSGKSTIKGTLASTVAKSFITGRFRQGLTLRAGLSNPASPAS